MKVFSSFVPADEVSIGGVPDVNGLVGPERLQGSRNHTDQVSVM